MTAVTSSPISHPEAPVQQHQERCGLAGWPLAHHGSTVLPNAMAELLGQALPAAMLLLLNRTFPAELSNRTTDR